MAYWTLSGLYGIVPADRVLQLVDHEDAGSLVVSPPNAAYTRVVNAGTKADTYIDTYLRGHYTLPLSTVPAMVSEMSNTLTAWFLYFLSDIEEIPAKIDEAYKSVIRMLEHIRDDKIRLFDEEQASGTIQVNKTSDDRLFPKTVLDQY
jgi:phage gp36-like protein